MDKSLRTKMNTTHTISMEDDSSLISILETTIDSIIGRYEKGIPRFDTGLDTPDVANVDVIVAVVSCSPGIAEDTRNFLRAIPGVVYKSVAHSKNPLTISEICVKVEISPVTTLTIFVHFGL